MSRSGSYDRPKCSDVADKLSQIFGWRQTYNVEKLQKHVQDRDIARISIIRSSSAEGSKPRTKEGSESWVAVRNLKSQGGGILDPDDRLSDVVDDREQIFVSFESDDGIHHHVGGDGASGSSDGTGSPDLFKDVGHKYDYRKMHRSSIKSRTDIEVTGANLANGCHIVPTLQVRRGSEPNLTQLDPPPPQSIAMGVIRSNPINDHTKRWSAAPLIVDSQFPQQSWQQEKPPDVCQETAAGRFWRLSHDSMLEQAVNDNPVNDFIHLPRNNVNRLSMQFTCDGLGSKVVERTYNSKAKISSRSLPRNQKRKEPLGQANSATSSPTATADLELDRSEVIVIRNDTGPLGIHVIPDYDRHGTDKGLLVQGIDPDGRVHLDGRLALYDRIIEINGQSLLNLPFQRVQEMFKLSLISPELSLRIIRADSTNSGKPPPPIYPRLSDNKENISKLDAIKKYDTTNMKVATVSPTKKLTTIPRNQKSLLTVNTRKIGRKIELELVKAPPPHGLGFSITTRDNPAGGNCPIYIKNIIPKGAAIQDGRLKIGDRLLEVNDVEMTGKSQGEAVSVLRNVTAGSKVRIVVSRQEDVPNTELPRVISVDTVVKPYSERNHDIETDRCPNYGPIKNGNNSGVVTSSNPTSSIPPEPLHHLLQQQVVPSHPSAEDIVANSPNLSSDIYSQPRDIYGDVSSFPWKYKQILTLDIPVHDSEKAGLGISVKGKTSGCQDLGIFIKSVINGGAASRDRRLRTNDQLLNVNNISLLYQSNSDAMETLRRAMLHTEGPVPGNITLTVARKALLSAFQSRSHQNAFLNRSFHDYLSASSQSDLRKSNKAINRSLDSSSIHDGSIIDDKGHYSMRNRSQDDFSLYSKLRYNADLQRSSSNYIADTMAEKSGGSTNTVIFNPKQNHVDISMNTWNPVLDKLTGDANKQLRNESYYKATNQCDTSTYSIPKESITNHVINTPFGETFLMEDEYGNGLRLAQNKLSKTHLPDRPNHTSYINQWRSKTLHEPLYTRHILNQNPNKEQQLAPSVNINVPPLKTAININNDVRKDVRPISSVLVPEENCSPTDLTYMSSQTSLKNQSMGFSRDAFGRQSMSEKRHAALDAKTTDTYQRSKKMREKRGKSKIETDTSEVGPSLGLKKSSSLESLQTMVQETQMTDGEPIYNYRGQFGGIGGFRGESCKSTFQKKDTSKKVVDPDHHSKISAKKHWLLDPPTDFNFEAAAFDETRGAPRQSSLKTTTISGKPKHVKKKSGLLKGIGTIFR